MEERCKECDEIIKDQDYGCENTDCRAEGCDLCHLCGGWITGDNQCSDCDEYEEERFEHDGEEVTDE